MNKILVGLVLGAILGIVDGATAWFTPEVRPMMLQIIVGSTIKGIMAGVAAGIFARKVHSTPAGIVFGLIVGLGLAYWVAAMQGKYYFEIMLPGAIVGAILGWATQRYGRTAGAQAATTVMMIALLGLSASAHAAPPPAFEKLKLLAGTWNATMLEPDGEKTTVEYRVTANGTVVMETMFPGTSHEMINMYTVDGDALVATHYCSAGNQPTLRLNAAKSNADELVFDFVKVTGKDTSYINGVRIRFNGNKVVEEWSSSAGGDLMILYLNAKK